MATRLLIMATVSSYDQQPLRLSSTERLDDGPHSVTLEREFEGQLKAFLQLPDKRSSLRRSLIRALSSPVLVSVETAIPLHR